MQAKAWIPRVALPIALAAPAMAVASTRLMAQPAAPFGATWCYDNLSCEGGEELCDGATVQGVYVQCYSEIITC